MSKFQPPGSLSPIEMAKSISGLVAMSETKKGFEEIKAAFIPDEHLPRVNQILEGFEHEDEFIILCKTMGTCESICRIDQSPVIASSEKAADFLASFAPGVSVNGLSAEKTRVRFSCIVEVKSCKKRAFKISQKDLKARRAFADRYGLPLIFAVRFTEFSSHSMWVWYEAGYLERHNRRIECTDMTRSLGIALLDDYALFPIPALHLIHYYDRSKQDGGIKHNEYGVQIKTYIATSPTELIEVPEELDLLVNLVFHFFEKEEVDVKSEGSITAVASHISGQMRLLSDLVYGGNHIAVDENGDSAFDARRVIAHQDSEKKPALITRTMIEHAVSFINHKSPLLLKMAMMEPKQQEKTLKKLIK